MNKLEYNKVIWKNKCSWKWHLVDKKWLEQDENNPPNHQKKKTPCPEGLDTKDEILNNKCPQMNYCVGK